MQLVAVLNISGKPPDNAIQVVMKTVVCVSSKPNKDAKRVELHKAVPMPAGSPGAAIVNITDSEISNNLHLLGAINIIRGNNAEKNQFSAMENFSHIRMELKYYY